MEQVEELRTALLQDCESILFIYKDAHAEDGNVVGTDAQNKANAEYLKQTLLEDTSKKIVLEWLRVMIKNNFYLTDEDNKFVFLCTHRKWLDISSHT